MNTWSNNICHVKWYQISLTHRNPPGKNIIALTGSPFVVWLCGRDPDEKIFRLQLWFRIHWQFECGLNLSATTGTQAACWVNRNTRASSLFWIFLALSILFSLINIIFVSWPKVYLHRNYLRTKIILVNKKTGNTGNQLLPINPQLSCVL